MGKQLPTRGFASAPLITKRLAHVEQSHPARRWGLYVGIFFVAIYGGYFGAGMGILLLAVMALCPQHQFQVLTKRPERMRAWFAEHAP